MDSSTLYPTSHSRLGSRAISHGLPRGHLHDASIATLIKSKTQPATTRTLSGRKRSSGEAALAETEMSSENMFVLDERTMALLRAQAAADLALRRKRNRMHQAKHTLRQKQKVEDLEAGIARLQDKIQQLNDQRRIVSASIVTNTSAWSVAAEYFRLFEN